jgi:hypothetical protein
MAERHLTEKERHEENEKFWQERRKYFRIDDNVMLKYRVIPTEEVAATTERLKAPTPSAFSLSSDFAEMREQMTLLRRGIEKSTPQIAQYMQMIDKKLDLVAKVLLVQNMGGDDHLWRMVNLGAGGMAFDSPVELPSSSILEIKLGLLPSHAGLRTLGKVLRSDKLPPGKTGYRVAVAFLHVRDSDRELLVQHVLWRQAQTLREQRSVTEE